MGLSKFFLNTGEALRPVLTKIIPMKLLSKMKAGIINNATDKLSADSIEKYEAGRYKCGANIIGNIKGDNGLFFFYQEVQEAMIRMMTDSQRSFLLM